MEVPPDAVALVQERGDVLGVARGGEFEGERGLRGRDSARESSDESNSGAPIWRSRMRTPEETPRERRGA